MGKTLKIPSPTKLARLGHFPPASQAGRLAGPMFYEYVYSLVLPIFSLICTAGFSLASAEVAIEGNGQIGQNARICAARGTGSVS
jgi:hypothetical protein